MKKKFKMLCGERGRSDYGKFGRYLSEKNKGNRIIEQVNKLR